MNLVECPCCKRKVREEDMTIHHYIPQSEGGTHQDTISLCKTCHRMLHKYIPIEDVKNYDTIYKLEQNEEFCKYLEWIRQKSHPSQYSVKKVLIYLKKYHQLVA